VQAVIVAHWARITESEGAMNSADRIILPAVVIGSTALWMFSVAAQTPAKTTLDGVYSEAQSKEGQSLYDDKCAKCHGPAGNGSGGAPDLASDAFTADWDSLTLSQMADRIRTSMPQDSPAV
jgi:mono/diheme cytochrome c family protein